MIIKSSFKHYKAAYLNNLFVLRHNYYNYQEDYFANIIMIFKVK